MNGMIEEKKKRYMRFYRFDPKQKLLFHIHVNDGTATAPPPRRRKTAPERVDWAVKTYEAGMRRLEWLDDDFIPYGNCITDTEIFAEAFGCRVARPPDERPFALPLITKASQVKEIKAPALEDSTLAYLFEMADMIKKRCGADALLNIVDPQTPMDIAAQIWDKNYFFPAMIEEPEAVKELARTVKGLFFAFFDEWKRRYGVEFIAHDPDYYMPGGMDVSEDEIGAVSPEMFEEFFLPELVEISMRYGGLGMHCCANSRHQWENLKKIPNFRMFNITHPFDNGMITDAISYFAGHTGMFPSWTGAADKMPGWTSAGNPEEWFPRLYGGAWVHLDFNANSADEAKAIAERLRSVF